MRRREHPDDTELLLALDGELALRRQAAVDAHLATCGTCRFRLDEIQSTLAEASAQFESGIEATLPSSQDGRLRLEHALRDAADEWNRPFRRRMTVGGPVWFQRAPDRLSRQGPAAFTAPRTARRRRGQACSASRRCPAPGYCRCT